MMIYRAVAYQRHASPDQPEATVFFEAAPSQQSPSAKLVSLLSLAWGCATTEVEFYNLWSEPELMRNSSLPAQAGDVRWLQNGDAPEGPGFVDPDRTLMFVRPLTAQRLRLAMERARVWRSFADARWQLSQQTLPVLPRLRHAIERAERRAGGR